MSYTKRRKTPELIEIRNTIKALRDDGVDFIAIVKRTGAIMRSKANHINSGNSRKFSFLLLLVLVLIKPSQVFFLLLSPFKYLCSFRLSSSLFSIESVRKRLTYSIANIVTIYKPLHCQNNQCLYRGQVGRTLATHRHNANGTVYLGVRDAIRFLEIEAVLYLPRQNTGKNDLDRCRAHCLFLPLILKFFKQFCSN